MRNATDRNDIELAEAVLDGDTAAWGRLERCAVQRCRTVLGWHHATPAERDVIDDATADACVWLRDVAIGAGQWQPELGGTLLGSVVRRAQLRYRTRAGRQLGIPRHTATVSTDALDVVDPCADTEASALAAVELDAFTGAVSPAIAAVAVAHGAGWTLAELADSHQRPVRALSTELWRARNTHRRRWCGPT